MIEKNMKKKHNVWCLSLFVYGWIKKIMTELIMEMDSKYQGYQEKNRFQKALDIGNRELKWKTGTWSNTKEVSCCHWKWR